jgi:hypothetical protein
MFPLAHVKWFVDENGLAQAFLLSESSTLVWLFIVIFGFVIAGLLNFWLSGKMKIGGEKVKSLQKLEKRWFKKCEKAWPTLLRIFQICLGISLFYASLNNVLLVPHYIIPEAWQFLIPLQALIGASFIANVWVFPAAAGLLWIYWTAMILFGFTEVLDYLNVLGMALFLMFVKGTGTFWENRRDYALPVLRILTGAALFVLAFSEKLWNIDAAMALVTQYDLNFMTMMGFENYSDRLFILSAGSMEALFGLILIFGFIIRINIIALTTFFLMTNIYFLLAGYPDVALMELMGHLPVIGSVVLFVAYGSGKMRLKMKP